MNDRDLLLQVCPNDNPPFADICRLYASAAQTLGWHTVTVMLEPRAPDQDPHFHYVRRDLRRQLGRLLDGRQPRLTICHRYRAWRDLTATGLASAPLVLIAHEFGLLARRRRRLLLRLDPLLGRPQALLAGVSDAVARELSGLGRQPALVLPNGVDLARCDDVRMSRSAARRALGLLDDEFNVGVVGRLHPKKDPALAVEGFRLALAARRPGEQPLRLTFLGDGVLAGELVEQASGLPVLFKGFVRDAARYMAAFDLLLLPSGDREAFGMVALEALGAGVPVLCGSAPGPRFVVGDAGLTFEPHTPQALAGALEEAAAAAASGELGRLVERGRARVEASFSVQAVAGRLADLAAGRLQALAVPPPGG
jgi:glycosyltransferase involved in cell wall biosynthesis